MEYHYEKTWMDHPGTQDRYLTEPELRVSEKKKRKPSLDTNRPVIICAHGFTASTYEWEEFKKFADTHSEVLVSNVLLGGHGRSIEAFEQSSRHTWGIPIIDEYQALSRQGFKNISLAGASTGATLMLEALLNGRFPANNPPKQLMMIDPLIIPTDKTLYLIPLVGLFIKNFPYHGFSEEERCHWYVNRPAKTLMELNSLRKEVQRLIKRRGHLTCETRLKIYKSKKDEAASPAGARFLKKKLTQKDGSHPWPIMIDSDKHVFTRGKGRAAWNNDDREMQLLVFKDIIKTVYQ